MTDRTKGIIGLSFLVLLLVLTLVGGHLKILVVNELYLKLCILSLFLSVPAILKTLHMMILKREEVETKIPNTRNYSWVTMLGITFFGPMILSFPVAIGAPSIIHAVISKPGSITVTIYSKPESYSYRGCKGNVYLYEYKYLFNDNICGLQPNDWKTIKAGDKLELFGTKSQLGFKVDSYKKLTS